MINPTALRGRLAVQLQPLVQAVQLQLLVQRVRADAQTPGYFPDRIAPLGDLRDCVPLEIVAVVAAAHLGLLTSK